MNRACEGYCGGLVNVEKVRTTADGERFCPKCYLKWINRVC